MTFAATARRFLLLPVALLAAAGCASDRERPPVKGPGSGVFVSSPKWLNGCYQSPDEEPRGASVRPRQDLSNEQLRASAPWIGTVGVRSRLQADCELGFGLCVPNVLGGGGEDTFASRRNRDVGVGCWLSFDF